MFPVRILPLWITRERVSNDMKRMRNKISNTSYTVMFMNRDSKFTYNVRKKKKVGEEVKKKKN